jgi:hypothetical protein
MALTISRLCKPEIKFDKSNPLGTVTSKSLSAMRGFFYAKEKEANFLEGLLFIM